MGTTEADNSLRKTQNPESTVHFSAVMVEDHRSTLYMATAGGFSDLATVIDPVPEATVNATNAAARLVDLKRKFNELQMERKSYHDRQTLNASVALGAALFTLGGSLLMHGPAAIHQRNRLKQIVSAMRECIGQINTLRNAFSQMDGWDVADKIVLCDIEAFTYALSRDELKGDL